MPAEPLEGLAALGFRVLGFRFWGLEIRFEGLGAFVGLRVYGLGVFRVEGFRSFGF